ncbi:MAG: hypothetical protein AAGA66_03730 [Bacteroidota bacterium]
MNLYIGNRHYYLKIQVLFIGPGLPGAGLPETTQHAEYGATISYSIPKLRDRIKIICYKSAALL